jgi:hypothetical protein
MCTRRRARAPALTADGLLSVSFAPSEKLLLLWLVDMRDVQLLLTLASEARENESRDRALAALLGSSAIS